MSVLHTKYFTCIGLCCKHDAFSYNIKYLMATMLCPMMMKNNFETVSVQLSVKAHIRALYLIKMSSASRKLIAENNLSYLP